MLKDGGAVMLSTGNEKKKPGKVLNVYQEWNDDYDNLDDNDDNLGNKYEYDVDDYMYTVYCIQ